MSHPPLSTQLFRIIIPVTGRPPPSFDRYGTRRSRGVTVPAVPLRSVTKDCADSGPCRDITDHAHGAATPERSRSRSLHSWPRLWRTSAARSSTRHVLTCVRGRAPPARRAHGEPVQDRARPVAPSVNARATQPPSETVRAETFSRPPERRGTPPVRGPVARRRAGRRPRRPSGRGGRSSAGRGRRRRTCRRSHAAAAVGSSPAAAPRRCRHPATDAGEERGGRTGPRRRPAHPLEDAPPHPVAPRAGGATAAAPPRISPPAPPCPLLPRAAARTGPRSGTKGSSPWRSAVHAARRGRIDGS
ncbi:hypothetical protein SUDANB32_02737 [Streptomyces sp. enrichment culture]